VKLGSNAFGKIFTVTTFGESHGKGIGCVIDGCPAGIEIGDDFFEKEMKKRRPGYSVYTSPRTEEDHVEVLSGIFEGKTTGAPVALWIKNKDAMSSSYEEVKDIIRVGHANYSYLQKYGIFDYRGGGRASARETAARVAAGAIAKKIIEPMHVVAKIIEMGGRKEGFAHVLKEAMLEGDSLGAVIECRVKNVPAGLGDPVYEKMESNLAKAIISINACCGIEFGAGFKAATMKGSEHNDEMEDGKFLSNHHGGILAGITTGNDIVFKAAFKPASSIKKEMRTITTSGKNITFKPKTNVRHDPCVAIRATVIVEAMTALVLVDHLLLNNSVKLLHVFKYLY